ncbi:hypothetical protein T10_8279 [Trichinella papuae]|uniref:Uncharacterized protein n=1 Tax=Trichinella papuae TaxID=268474 RepID=A0A0V1N2E8_9BILA|nr:hypothetical protein T10_8279 [Trichinella papuae]
MKSIKIGEGFQQVLSMNSNKDSKESQLRPLANRNYNLEESVITLNFYEYYGAFTVLSGECHVYAMWLLDKSQLRGIDIEKLLGHPNFSDMQSRFKEPYRVRMNHSVLNSELANKSDDCCWFQLEMSFVCKHEDIKLTLQNFQYKLGMYLSEKISEFLSEGIITTSMSNTIPKLVTVNFFLQELSNSYTDKFLFSLRKVIHLSNKKEIVCFPSVLTGGISPTRYILLSSFSFPLHLKKNFLEICENTASSSYIENDAAIIEPDESTVSQSGIPSFCGKCRTFFYVSSESLHDNDGKEN